MIYDIAVDLIKHLSISLDFLKPYATLSGVIVLLLRQNNIKKMINGHLPKKFRDTQSNDIYEMMRDIKDIKVHLGVEERWSLPEVGSPATCPKLLKYWMKLKGAIPMDKMKSRKFWMAILAAIIPVINIQFGLHLDFETIVGIWTMLGVGIAALAHVDGKKAAAIAIKAVTTSPIIDMSFKEAIPMIKTIHDGINNLLADVKKDDGSRAYKDAMQAYGDILAVLEANKHPEPVQNIPEAPNQQESA